MLFISVLCMCDIVFEKVSLTHQLGDTLVSDNNTLCFKITLTCCQRCLNAGPALLALYRH